MAPDSKCALWCENYFPPQTKCLNAVLGVGSPMCSEPLQKADPATPEKAWQEDGEESQGCKELEITTHS